MLELCRVSAADGLHLEGLFEQPRSPISTALLLIHGTGANFYSRGILERVAQDAVAASFPVLRINTRGHDLVCSVTGSTGSAWQGAAFENVLDCRLDIAAWCEWLQDRGYERAILIGHSLGAVKALWSCIPSCPRNVAAIAAISPPRFVHAKLQQDPRCDAFRRDFARAAELAASGQPQALLSITQPLPMLITAQGFLDKYGPHDPLDYVPVLDEIAIPKLILLGQQSVDTNPAFADLPAVLSRCAAEQAMLQVELLEGADINYRHQPAAVWQRISSWLQALDARS